MNKWLHLCKDCARIIFLLKITTLILLQPLPTVSSRACCEMMFFYFAHNVFPALRYACLFDRSLKATLVLCNFRCLKIVVFNSVFILFKHSRSCDSRSVEWQFLWITYERFKALVCHNLLIFIWTIQCLMHLSDNFTHDSNMEKIPSMKSPQKSPTIPKRRRKLLSTVDEQLVATPCVSSSKDKSLIINSWNINLAWYMCVCECEFFKIEISS